MKSLPRLIKRNAKLFFKDKGMFFSSLITPLILLVLYATFLANVYRDSLVAALGDAQLPERLINGAVGAQLFSALLAVSCITVAFCSNLIMVQDKVTGAAADFSVSPVKKSQLAIAYYISTAAVTVTVCLVAMAICFIYIACIGWYIRVGDVFLILLDVFILVMFGTALSSIVNCFLSTQGQMSAVGTIVSAGYGFLCGAYMPISQFSDGLQKALMFLPGTYGTSLIRNHSLAGAFGEMKAQGVPEQALNGLMKGLDCTLEFFGHEVGTGIMYAVMLVSIVVLVGIYVLINVFNSKKCK